MVWGFFLCWILFLIFEVAFCTPLDLTFGKLGGGFGCFFLVLFKFSYFCLVRIWKNMYEISCTVLGLGKLHTD